MTRVSARRNRERGIADENRAAEKLGGIRWWANAGGPEDVEHKQLTIQVRGGLTVTTVRMRDGLAKAQSAAVGTSKVPCLYVVDRSGTRLKEYVMFEVGQLNQWLGWPRDEWLEWKRQQLALRMEKDDEQE